MPARANNARTAMPYAVTWHGNPFYGITGHGIVSHHRSADAARQREWALDKDALRLVDPMPPLFLYSVVDCRDGTIVHTYRTQKGTDRAQDTTQPHTRVHDRAAGTRGPVYP